MTRYQEFLILKHVGRQDDIMFCSAELAESPNGPRSIQDKCRYIYSRTLLRTAAIELHNRQLPNLLLAAEEPLAVEVHCTIVL